jgi:nucleoside-diphosphate-sugar epimerase
MADDRETTLMKEQSCNILVLGASGLIGRFVTDDLRARGFGVIGIARKFAASQASHALDLEVPVLGTASAALARLLRDRAIDVVVNCLGVLQDGPGSDTDAVHRDFVARLLRAIADSGRAVRLIHISIPERRPHRLQPDQTGGRTADCRLRRSLCDPEARLCGCARGLWRQCHGARAGGAAD